MSPFGGRDGEKRRAELVLAPRGGQVVAVTQNGTARPRPARRADRGTIGGVRLAARGPRGSRRTVPRTSDLIRLVRIPPACRPCDGTPSHDVRESFATMGPCRCAV